MAVVLARNGDARSRSDRGVHYSVQRRLHWRGRCRSARMAPPAWFFVVYVRDTCRYCESGFKSVLTGALTNGLFLFYLEDPPDAGLACPARKTYDLVSRPPPSDFEQVSVKAAGQSYTGHPFRYLALMDRFVPSFGSESEFPLPLDRKQEWFCIGRTV